MRDLPRIVAETDVDKQVVDVEIMRNGKKIILQVTLGELEQAENGGLLSGEHRTKPNHLVIWALAQNSLMQIWQVNMGLMTEDEAVVVTEVINGLPAAEKGLQAGDVIVRFGQSRITSGRASLSKVLMMQEKLIALVCSCLLNVMGKTVSFKSPL